MAIKGKGYVKTSWSFEERPVSSSKLNLWDDNIEKGLELVHELLSLAWGGGDGVIRGAATDDLRVLAKTPEDLTVEVEPGKAFIDRSIYVLETATGTPSFTPPSVNPRIDLVQADLDMWAISVKEGVEDASPSAPSVDVDCIALAHIYCRAGMTSIKNTDDSVNGYVVDARQYV
ncbi:hypothetical protein ACFL1X_03350 [Candidatus Hydrogenedentota bacterium]